MRANRVVLPVIACLAACLAPSGADAKLRACKAVRHPYPGTRYANVDLTHIRTSGGSCASARYVARKAHWKALSKSSGPVERFTWHGWAVTGDLRPDRDRYVARKAGRQVRWRF